LPSRDSKGLEIFVIQIDFSFVILYGIKVVSILYLVSLLILNPCSLNSLSLKYNKAFLK